MEETMVVFSGLTRLNATNLAKKGTKYLTKNGCNSILMCIKTGNDGWGVEIPVEIAKVWPGIFDIMTGS